MNKIITRIINLIIISNVVLFCSCSNSEFESRLLQDSITNVSETQIFIENADEPQAKSFSESTIEITDYEKIDISDFESQRLTLDVYSGNNLFLTYMNDGYLYLYLYNTESKEQKLISEIEWNAMYCSPMIINGRYYVIMPSKNTEDGLVSKLYVYDVESDEFYEADSFYAHNIVQYWTCVNDDKLAYVYYESESKDRIIRLYDFSEKSYKELYRIDGQDKYSPMGLTFNGENLVLALQLYNEEYETETVLKEINLQGNEVTSTSTYEYPLSLIRDVFYNNGYYITYGNRFRAKQDYSTVYSIIKNNEIKTVLSTDKKLKFPMNFFTDNNLSFYTCANNRDIVSVNITDGEIKYYDIVVPDCSYMQCAVSNERNDIAVIKYSDENQTKSCLVLITNDKISE